MRMVTGAILIAAAEQAFSHAHLIGFPHSFFASEVLLPTSLVLVVVGLGCLIWGTAYFVGRACAVRENRKGTWCERCGSSALDWRLPGGGGW